MSPAALVGATILVVALVSVIPRRGRARYLELANPATTAQRRRSIHLESMALKWSLAALALVLCWGAPFPIDWWPTASGVPISIALLVGVGGGAVLLRFRLRSPRHRVALAAAAAKFVALLPRSRSERRLFALFSVTAGVTEEIIFRAFLIAYVVWLLPGGNVYVAAVVAGVVFGVLHLYQGWKGVAQTALLGVGFGLLYPSVGLVVLMVVHSLFDVRLLVLPADLADSVAIDAAEPDGDASPAGG